MAGQPPEPSYQPSGQDQGLTQGRPAWQQPSYPPAPSGGQQAYAAPPPSYSAQDQAYGAQDQTYTSLGPGQTYQDYQGYQGYQPPAYGAPQGQDQGQGQGQGAATPPPQWQVGAAGAKPAPPPRTKQHGEKGFLGSLFDFSFTSLVTPKIIKVLYILFTIWTGLAAVGIFAYFVDFGGFEGAIGAIIVDAIFVMLSLGVYRVIL
jgi:Domain of unknown function (DUF4282)